MKKMCVRFLIFSLFLMSNLSVFALPTFVRGKAIGGVGLFIRVTTYADRLSNEIEILDLDEIKTDEHFDLGFDINLFQEIFVEIGNQRFSFIAESGKTYELQIENIESPPRSALAEHKALHVTWAKTNSLNEAIDNFNYEYSQFLEANFIALYKYRDAKLLQSFETEIQAKLALTTNLSESEFDFFSTIISYQFADLKNASLTMSDISLGEIYLKDQPVLYDHPAYMHFFKQYFRNYFAAAKRDTKYTEFIELIASKTKVSELLNAMGKDPILLQERLRELVFILALQEVYYNKDFDADRIENLLKSMGASSKFTEHRAIAKSILNQLTNLSLGKPAPNFSLQTTKGVQKSLKDYQGKYVYLVFTSDHCQACDEELKLLTPMQKKYKTEIAIVNLFVNYTANGLIDLKKEAENPFDQLVFNANFELLNSYRVRSFPLYVLIDRSGNTLLYPAKKPHEGIERFFDYLIRKDLLKEEKGSELFR